LGFDRPLGHGQGTRKGTVYYLIYYKQSVNRFQGKVPFFPKKNQGGFPARRGGKPFAGSVGGFPGPGDGNVANDIKNRRYFCGFSRSFFRNGNLCLLAKKDVF
jgi:hypothetical protein